MNSRVLAFVAIAVVCLAIGIYGARTFEKSRCAKEAESTALAMAESSNTLRSAAEQWSESLAKTQGEAILRSFVAGVAPVMLAGREQPLDIASTSLLRLPGVQGVIILRADGKTLYSSDAKLIVTDAGNERTRWALTATDFMSRDQLGVMEMSLPITDRGTIVAVVWLSYAASRIREEHRPESLAPL